MWRVVIRIALNVRIRIDINKLLKNILNNKDSGNDPRGIPNKLSDHMP